MVRTRVADPGEFYPDTDPRKKTNSDPTLEKTCGSGRIHNPGNNKGMESSGLNLRQLKLRTREKILKIIKAIYEFGTIISLK